MKAKHPKKVTGSECLNYIDKPIGFANKSAFGSTPSYALEQQTTFDNPSAPCIKEGTGVLYGSGLDYSWTDAVYLSNFNHNINKRIVGYIEKEYDDGGLKVIVLGQDETFDIEHEYYHTLSVSGGYSYEPVGSPELDVKLSTPINLYPEVSATYPVNTSHCALNLSPAHDPLPFDEMLDYQCDFVNYPYGGYGGPAFDRSNMIDGKISNDPNHTLIFGDGLENLSFPFYYAPEHMYDPLRFLQGDLYQVAIDANFYYSNLFPGRFVNYSQMRLFRGQTGEELHSFNLTAIPYNLILTKNVNYAKAYINNETLPPDAFLFPLDWEDLPGFDEEPDDFPDDNKPGDTDRDIDPNLPVVPSFTPSMLSNYNWYWLSVPQYSDFIRWFWNDIGDYNDFDDIIAKIEGLYNDVASAVLMVRFFPVEIGWIGGAGTDSTIKLGMIEKAGNVQTIDQLHAPQVREIGHIKIPTKYNSFCDLAPYTQLSIYLPWHGFVDLDIDLLMGHDIYVKGIYDYLSGTLQYLLYYDNEMLINSFIVKIAMDIPITLQTKNDRDSVIFSNVSNALAGLIGAGTTLASGNPMGMLVGANAINGTMNSAPMKVMGSLGESGAYYAPQKCYIILRRPTIQGSDGATDVQNLATWSKNVGKLCGFGWTLSKLSGLTVCYTPRIEFKNSTPLQSEIDEIYEYLEKGVIL